MASHQKVDLIEHENNIFFRSYPKGKLSFPCHESLGLDDLLHLTRRAFSIKWYDRAIDFLRAAFKLLPSLEGTSQYPSEKTVKRMDKMRKDLVKLNNNHLYKHKSSVSTEYKTHLHIVTDKLGKKKEQPDFVVQGEVLGFENSTRQVLMKTVWHF